MTHVDLHVTAGRDQVGEPWLWRLSREFNLKVNVRRANVDLDYGWLQLELSGPVEEIQRATAWLMTTGLHVEAQQRAVGATSQTGG
jgi:L-aspartate semialdehyde sulfurtransferase ferredoxin